MRDGTIPAMEGAKIPITPEASCPLHLKGPVRQTAGTTQNPPLGVAVDVTGNGTSRNAATDEYSSVREFSF